MTGLVGEHAVDTALMNNYGSRSLCMVRGSGMHLYDEAGREFLDCTAGIAVCSLGHSHPAITAEIRNQAETLIHCSNLYTNVPQRTLAQKLSELSGLDKVFFCNSGTEANEAAIKLARRYAYDKGHTDRTEIVSLPGGFHGRTLGSLSITPKPAYQKGFGPLIPKCFTPDSLESVLDSITERTAACIVEVVQGEGGVRPVPATLLHAIATRCKEVGALLVVDEVQTGVGRTGTFFAFQAIGLSPDIVTMAKGLAGGVPIGAMLAKNEIAASFVAGTHGSTFGGNPLATAVGNVVVDVVSQPQFLQQVAEVGRHLAETMAEFGDDVSGNGLMLGMTVPDAKAFVARATDCGVLLTAVGDTRVRCVPPLVMEHHHVEEFRQRLTSI